MTDLWTLAAAAGLGAAWLTDALKPWLSMRARTKAFVFLGIDAALLAVQIVFFPKVPSAPFVVAAGLLSLAFGKALHGFLSLLQAMKDRNRVEVVGLSSMASGTGRRA